MENNKFQCNQKETCIQMRNSSLKSAIDNLKINLNESNGYIVIATLISIIHLLEEFECVCCEELLKKVIEVKKSNEDSSDNSASEIRLRKLISDLEIFLERGNNQ